MRACRVAANRSPLLWTSAVVAPGKLQDTPRTSRRSGTMVAVPDPETRGLTAEEITRHYDEGEVVYVGAHPTDYVLRIEEPNPSWSQRYEVVAGEVVAALGPRALHLQHMGSTSVPGLPAKPIIDIDLTVADPTIEAAYVPALEAIGFVHWLTEPNWHGHRLLKLLARRDVRGDR